MTARSVAPHQWSQRSENETIAQVRAVNATPMPQLLPSILDTVDIHLDSIGDSTDRLTDL